MNDVIHPSTLLVYLPRASSVFEAKSSHSIPKFGTPQPQPIVDPTQDFEFFQFESEYHLIPGRGLNVYQYGRSPDGASVLVRSTGFRPHFSIKINPKWEYRHFQMIRQALEDALKQKRRSGQDARDARNFTRFIAEMTPYEGNSLMSYNGEKPERFLKIEVAYPKLVKECRALFEYPRGKNKTKFSPEVPDWWPLEVPPLVEDKDVEFPTYETNVDFMLRFQVDHKIRATGWVKLKAGQYKVLPQAIGERVSCSEVEIICDHTTIGYSPRPSTDVPPYVVYSWDIEAETGPNHEFPKAKSERDEHGNITREGQKMLQIGFKKALVKPDKIEESQGIHMIGGCAEIKDAKEVYCYNSEANLLRGFHSDLKATVPDFIIGYNTANFDLPYWYGRVQENNVYNSFGDIGRIKGLLSRCYNSSFSSSAHKTEKMVTTMNGATHVDVMQCIKRDKKLRSYGLNAVAQQFLKKGKIEMDYNKINELQETEEGRAVLGYYCMIDSCLPWELVIELRMITNYIQMAYVAGVSIQQLLDRGQQIRMLAQVYHYAKDTVNNPIPDGTDPRKKLLHPYVVPVYPTYRKWPVDKFEGAVVVNAQTGLHHYPVTTLDFSSLYPSIIIAKNFCWTTWLSDATIKKYGLIEGIHYQRMLDCVVNNDEYQSVTEVYNPKNPCFLKTPLEANKGAIKKLSLVEGVHYKIVNGSPVIIANEETIAAFTQAKIELNTHFTIKDGEIVWVACKKGVMPILLEGLLAKRKEVRGKAEGEINKAILAIIDALQNAYKVMANSMYGATGTGEKGYLPLRELAESVTREGRRMILTVAWKVREKYNKKNGFPFRSNVIYGDTDSVFIEFADPEAPLELPKDQTWKHQINADLLFEAPYDFDYVRDVSLDMASYVSGFFLKPISMAYEKSFNGILLVSKKRYAGFKLVWTVDANASFATGYKKPVYDADGQINVKESKKGGWIKTVYAVDKTQSKFSATGLENVRRDSCPLVSEMVDKVLKMVIVKRDVPGAVKYSREEISKLLLGNQPFAKLVITRALSRKAEEYATKMAHVELAEKQRKRDPATAPHLGDRVKYVKLVGTKGQKTHELGEDPFYAFDNNMTLDYEWYLSNQLKRPLQRIFYFVFKNIEVTRHLASLETEADWVKIHDVFGSGLKEEDLMFQEEDEEDKEAEALENADFGDSDPEFLEFFEGLEVHHGDARTIGDKMDTSLDSPPSPPPPPPPEPKVGEKRKQGTIGDFFGGAPKIAKPEDVRFKGKITAKARKEIEKSNQAKKKKEQEKAMEGMYSNRLSIFVSNIYIFATTKVILKSTSLMWVTTREALKKIKVSPSTLRLWDQKELVKTKRTPGGHRLYDLSSLETLFNTELAPNDGNPITPTEELVNIAYCRVSTRKQKENLDRQVEYMRSKYPDHIIISDIGSGINFKRKGLQTILARAFEGRLRQVTVSHRDRLCRFAFDLIQWILEKHGAKVVVENTTEHSHEEEFTEDLLSIVHVFSSRFNGMRRYKRKLEDTTDKEEKDNDDGQENKRTKVPEDDEDTPDLHLQTQIDAQ